MDKLNNFHLMLLDYCREIACRKGVEYAYIVNDADKIILEKEGTAESVKFTPEEVNKISLEHDAIILHSHPIEVSLSRQDLHFATYVNATIAAITCKGNLYWSNGKHDKDRILESVPSSDIANMLSFAQSFPIRQAINYNYHHMFWLHCQHWLQLDYHYKIQEATQEEISQVVSYYRDLGFTIKGKNHGLSPW